MEPTACQAASSPDTKPSPYMYIYPGAPTCRAAYSSVWELATHIGRHKKRPAANRGHERSSQRLRLGAAVPPAEEAPLIRAVKHIKKWKGKRVVHIESRVMSVVVCRKARKGRLRAGREGGGGLLSIRNNGLRRESLRIRGHA